MHPIRKIFYNFLILDPILFLFNVIVDFRDWKLDNINNKVLIIESIIKSNVFLNYLKKLIINILYENQISFSSIKKDGYFYIIKMKKNDELVFAMDLLIKSRV